MNIDGVEAGYALGILAIVAFVLLCISVIVWCLDYLFAYAMEWVDFFKERKRNRDDRRSYRQSHS